MRREMGSLEVSRKRGICWPSYAAASPFLIQSLDSVFYGLK
jgi:hypothetical protein